MTALLVTEATRPMHPCRPGAQDGGKGAGTKLVPVGVHDGAHRRSGGDGIAQRVVGKVRCRQRGMPLTRILPTNPVSGQPGDLRCGDDVPAAECKLGAT